MQFPDEAAQYKSIAVFQRASGFEINDPAVAMCCQNIEEG